MASTYVVKSGDTLSGIAKQLGISNWRDLYNQNKSIIGGNPNLIRAGQSLSYGTSAPTAPPPSGGLSKEFISKAYRTVFDREVDPEGLRHFSLPKFAGTSMTSLEAALKDSDEYRKLQAKLTSPDTRDDAQSALDKLTEEQFSKLEEAAAPPLRTSETIRKSIEEEVTPTITKPPPLDYVAEFKKLQEEADIETLESSVNDLTSQEDELQAELRKLTTDEQGKPILTSLITGRVGKFVRNAQEQLDFIGRQKTRLVNSLNIKYNTINTIMNLTEKTYDDAYSMYKDEYTQNLNMINTVRGIAKDEKSEADSIADDARANLQIWSKYIQSGEVNFTDLDANRQLQLNKMEIQAGLGAGFLQSIQAKLAGAEIKSTTTRQAPDGYKYVDMVVIDADGSVKVISQKLGKYKGTTGDGDPDDKREIAFQKSVADTIKGIASANYDYAAGFDMLKARYPEVSDGAIHGALNQAKRDPEYVAPTPEGVPEEIKDESTKKSVWWNPFSWF